MTGSGSGSGDGLGRDGEDGDHHGRHGSGTYSGTDDDREGCEMPSGRAEPDRDEGRDSERRDSAGPDDGRRFMSDDTAADRVSDAPSPEVPAPDGAAPPSTRFSPPPYGVARRPTARARLGRWPPSGRHGRRGRVRPVPGVGTTGGRTRGAVSSSRYAPPWPYCWPASPSAESPSRRSARPRATTRAPVGTAGVTGARTSVPARPTAPPPVPAPRPPRVRAPRRQTVPTGTENPARPSSRTRPTGGPTATATAPRAMAGTAVIAPARTPATAGESRHAPLSRRRRRRASRGCRTSRATRPGRAGEARETRTGTRETQQETRETQQGDREAQNGTREREQRSRRRSEVACSQDPRTRKAPGRLRRWQRSGPPPPQERPRPSRGTGRAATRITYSAAPAFSVTPLRITS